MYLYSARHLSLVAFGCTLLQIPLGAMAQSATIEGTITADSSGNPIANATVAISDPADDENFAFVTDTTDAAGNYAITIPVPSGSREVIVEAAGPDHAPARHGFSGSLPCFFNCGSGGEVTVSDGSTTTGVDIALVPGGRISGTITNADDGNPVHEAFASLVTPDFRRFSIGFSGSSQPNGSFTTGLALPPGTYRAIAGKPDGFVTQAWDSNTCELMVCPIAAADPVDITAGNVTGGFNFALEPGASITGDLAPDNIQRMVMLFNAAGQNLALELLEPPATSWSFEGLAGGSYFIQLGPISGESSYVRQLHNGLPCPFSGCERARGIPSTVTAGSAQALGSITLAQGGQIQGTVLDAATGTPPVGVPSDAQLGNYDIIDAVGNVLGGGSIRSDSSGNIVLETSSAVSAGDYFVRTYNEFLADGIGHASAYSADSLPGYMDAVFPDIPCAGINCDLAAADTISVTNGGTTSISIEIDTGSSISGTVIDTTAGNPLPDVIVRVVNAANETLASILTDATGAYQFGAFPAGSYYVRTSASGRLGPGHGGIQNAYFDKVHGAAGNCSEQLCDPASGTAVILSGNTDATVPDIELLAGPVISGQIIDLNTGYAIPRGRVEVYNDAGILVGTYPIAFLDARYQTTALPPGTYSLVPVVSPAYTSVAASGGSSPMSSGKTTSGSGFTVTIGTDDVAANLQVVDQAIDRLFTDRFGETP